MLNEPENNLHPDLIAPLARLIAGVSERTQVWVIADSEALVTELDRVAGCLILRLARAAWRWP